MCGAAETDNRNSLGLPVVYKRPSLHNLAVKDIFPKRKAAYSRGRYLKITLNLNFES